MRVMPNLPSHILLNNCWRASKYDIYKKVELKSLNIPNHKGLLCGLADAINVPAEMGKFHNAI
jgi:hypothetical protein